ncbi:MAG: universal stress protein [Desulfobacterales bacterium]|nr:universal stress protein [Desulfobacterales bacterium]
MFEKILFATTASPLCNDASNVAFELAKRYNSKLYIFHALGFPTHGFSPFVVDFKTGEKEYYSQQYIDKVKEEIEKTYADQLKGLDNYVIETWAGVPYTEILRLARKEDVDLVIMGPHTKAEKGVRSYRSVVGSTMQGSSRGARCPVMIVGRAVPKAKLEFANILFGTDFSKASDAAFLFAYNMAKKLGSKLYLFHALGIISSPGAAIDSQEEIEKKLEEVKEKIKDRYISRLEGFDNYEIKTWEGIPYMEIVKFSRRKEIDLIVMAHHSKEKDPEKALLGSTLEQVVIRAGCPVVSVNRPEKVADLKE